MVISKVASMEFCQEEVYDVFIIGAGWSGLLACRYAKQHGLSTIVVEKREDIGGVWKYSPDVEVTTVMKSTHTSSSSALTEISDFPMPDEIGEFPSHSDIYNYLDKYATKHSLRENIHFNCSVRNIQKVGNEWRIDTDTGPTYCSKNVIISTGVHQSPNKDLEQTLLKTFEGPIIHSSIIKDFIEEHRNKRVMIIGGGETASDILDNWYPHCQTIIWSIPNGQHFFRKYGKIFPHRKPQAFDKASSRLLKVIAPFTKGKPGLAWLCRWITSGSILAYQGHGIPEFRNNAQFHHAFINKHAHVLDYIDYKKVIPKGPISHVEGKTVHFKDGSSKEVDVIILSTGYKRSFPFLPKSYQCDLTQLYKYIFHPKDTTLSFVGYVRPVIGSIPGISEMQARFVCSVINKEVTIPCEKERNMIISNDRKFWENFFKDTSQRVSTLVDAYTYVDDIAKQAECYPNYFDLLKRNPKGFWTAITAPGSISMYNLSNPELESSALENLEKHRKSSVSLFYYLVILFLRLMMFEWFCGLLGDIKYKIQISPIWKDIREHQIIRGLDYFWCTPKRMLFDNKTK